jgi:hypothetical protein
MFVASGYSVILFAPVAALGAVLFTDPTLVAPMFTGLFMDKMVGFVKNYFPVFLLGAVFGKVIELSGFSKAIVASVIKLVGASGPCSPSCWSARCSPTAACRCSWWSSRSIRLPPRCSARAAFPSA